MNRINLFSRLIERYRFVSYVAPEIQKFVGKSGKRILKSSLRSVGNFSYSYGFVITVYHAARRLGFRPSLLAAKITAAAVSAVFIAGTVAAVVAATNSLAKSISKETNSQMHIDNTVKAKQRPAVSADKQHKAEVKFRIGIRALESKNIDVAISKKVTDRIAQKLSSIMGREVVVDLRETRMNKSVNNMLTGSVGRFGDKIFISVKVIDLSNSKVVAGINEIPGSDSMEEINNSCESIARGISDKFK